MAKHERSVLPGTVDLVILRVLAEGPMHGFGISRTLREHSDGVVELDDAALYQALHRLENRKLLEGEWGTSENNRRAKFYRLTSRGREQLEKEVSEWRRYAAAIARILETGARP
jgi:transcriptional regulator